MNSTKIALVSLLTVSVFVAGKASGSTLYGGALTGGAPLSAFFTIDQSTGARTPVASNSFGYIDLASDWRPQSYRLWGVVQDGQATLTRIDPATGSRTVVGPMANNIQSLAFDPTTETLFGAAITGLYKIDVNTANTTFVGSSAVLYPYDSLGCDLAGNLFAFYLSSLPNGVARIDKTTGAFQLGGPTTTPDLVWLNDLAVRPEDGVMIGIAHQTIGSSKLYQVNTTTGALTPIGNTQTQPILGLAFSPVPEPATIVLVAATLPMLIARRRESVQHNRV